MGMLRKEGTVTLHRRKCDDLDMCSHSHRDYQYPCFAIVFIFQIVKIVDWRCLIRLLLLVASHLNTDISGDIFSVDI